MPSMPSRSTSLNAFVLFLTAVLFAEVSAAVDGEVRSFRNWSSGGSVEVADVVTSPGVAYAIGTLTLPAAAPALHWKAFDDGLTPLPRGCSQPTGSMFPLGVSSAGAVGLVDSSGNLLIGGWVSFFGSETTRRALVARFVSTGSGCVLDPTFSTNGFEFFDDESWCDDEDCEVIDLVEIRPPVGGVTAPRTVALVRSAISTLSSRIFLLALDSSGAIDLSFGEGGWAEVAAPGLGILFPDARLGVWEEGELWVLVSRYEPQAQADLDLLHFRFDADGAPAMFPIWSIADHGPDDPWDAIGRDLAMAPGGDIMVSYRLVGGSSFLNVYDTSFGPGTFSDPVQPYEVAFEGPSKALGAADRLAPADGFVVVRWWWDVENLLPADLSYGDAGGGVVLLDVDLGGTDAESVRELTIWGHSALVAGTASNPSGTSGFLFLLEGGTIFEDGFESGDVGEWSSTGG